MGNEKINKGYIDYIYAFKIFDKESIKFDDFIKKLKQCNLIISKYNYNSKTNNYEMSFNERFERYLTNRNENFLDKVKSKPNFFNEDFADYDKYIKMTPLVSGDIAVDVIRNDTLEISQVSFLNAIAANNYFESAFLRADITNVKDVLLLQPFKIRKNSVFEYAWITVSVYKNGMATLRITNGIHNLTVDELSISKLCYNFDETYIPKYLLEDTKKMDYIQYKSNIDVSDMAKLYIKYLCKINSISINKYFMFTNITLIDYSYKPANFTKLKESSSGGYYQILYKLLSGPVREYTEQEDSHAEIWVKERAFTMSKYHKYYISSSSKSVAIFTQDMDTLIKNSNGKYSYMTFYHASVNGILMPIEYILFEKFLYDEFLIHKLNTDMSVVELRKLKLSLFDEDTFFSYRYGFGYGTLKELLEFMEDKLDFFLQSDFIKERSAKVQELIKLREDEKKEKFNVITRWVGIFLPLLFSFPTINAIMTTIQDTYSIEQLKYYKLPLWIGINIIFYLTIIYIYRKLILNKFSSIKWKVKRIFNRIRNR